MKVDYLAEAIPLLLGDYNNDGAVNAADYTVYRNRKAGIGGTTLLNDAGAECVTIDDYLYWKAHYGESAGSAERSNMNVAVAEPTSLVMLLAGMLPVFSRRRVAVP